MASAGGPCAPGLSVWHVRGQRASQRSHLRFQATWDPSFPFGRNFTGLVSLCVFLTQGGGSACPEGPSVPLGPCPAVLPPFRSQIEKWPCRVFLSPCGWLSVEYQQNPAPVFTALVPECSVTPPAPRSSPKRSAGPGGAAWKAPECSGSPCDRGRSDRGTGTWQPSSRILGQLSRSSPPRGLGVITGRGKMNRTPLVLSGVRQQSPAAPGPDVQRRAGPRRGPLSPSPGGSECSLSRRPRSSCVSLSVTRPWSQPLSM